MGFGHQHDHMVKFHLHVPHLHLHHHHHDGHEPNGKRGTTDIPKGFVAIMVGHEDEEELQRFVIPVIYINHPLFMLLLKDAEEEYGFHHDGPITIPCHVEEFRHVQDIIDEETHRRHGHGQRHGGGCENRHNNHHHHHHFWCFRV